MGRRRRYAGVVEMWRSGARGTSGGASVSLGGVRAEGARVEEPCNELVGDTCILELVSGVGELDVPTTPGVAVGDDGVGVVSPEDGRVSRHGPRISSWSSCCAGEVAGEVSGVIEDLTIISAVSSFMVPLSCRLVLTRDF